MGGRVGVGGEGPGGGVVFERKGTSLTPPRDRHGTHAFVKGGALKDARYTGMWRDGKICNRFVPCLNNNNNNNNN